MKQAVRGEMEIALPGPHQISMGNGCQLMFAATVTDIYSSPQPVVAQVKLLGLR